MNKVRAAIAVSVSVLCAGLLAPVVARACTVAATFTDASPSGAPGSQTVVHGGSFATGALVDVRWADATTGPLLAQPTGSAFTLVLTIPSDAKPGFYAIYADDHVGSGAPKQFIFTVTAPPRSAVVTTTPADSTPPAPTMTTDAPPPTSQGTTSPSTTSPTTASATSPAGSPTSLGTAFGGLFQQSPAPAGPSAVNSPAAPVRGGSSGGSLPARTGRGTAASAPAPAEHAASTQGSPSAAQGTDRSDKRVLGDLWGGFVKGGTASSHAPGLIPSPRGNVGAGLAVALLAAGLVALAAGLGVMEIRRSRAVATNS